MLLPDQVLGMTVTGMDLNTCRNYAAGSTGHRPAASIS